MLSNTGLSVTRSETDWAPAERLVFAELEEPDVVTVTSMDEELEESKLIVSGYWVLAVRPYTLEKVVPCLLQLDLWLILIKLAVTHPDTSANIAAG